MKKIGFLISLISASTNAASVNSSCVFEAGDLLTVGHQEDLDLDVEVLWGDNVAKEPIWEWSVNEQKDMKKEWTSTNTAVKIEHNNYINNLRS